MKKIFSKKFSMCWNPNRLDPPPPIKKRLFKSELFQNFHGEFESNNKLTSVGGSMAKAYVAEKNLCSPTEVMARCPYA